MSILITGGAGYIGSHAVRILSDGGYDVVVIDNLSRGHREAVGGAKLYEGSVGDRTLLRRIFTENTIDCVMHFAALSLVGESMSEPSVYYQNNVAGTLTMLDEMIKHNVKNIVFSSTAAVYGNPDSVPITENAQCSPINPYGETKLTVEHALKWFDEAYGLKYACLRYFNVAGAHKSGEIGEEHQPETHIIPLILSVARGENESVEIYGSDYETADGTCIRDYIHVEDLIDAHIKAMRYIQTEKISGVFNLGSGGGYSNLQILEAARRVTSHPIPAVMMPHRPGDPDVLIASSDKASSVLGWKREYTQISDIIASAWKYYSRK